MAGVLPFAPSFRFAGPGSTRGRAPQEPRLTPSALIDQARAPHTPSWLLGQLATESPELALAVAANPSAPPGLLRRLASRGEPALARAVCLNPSTPAHVAYRLAEQFVADFAATPRGTSLFSAWPGVEVRVPRAPILRALLGSPEAPAYWVRQAAEHPYPGVRAALAGRADLTPELLGRFLTDPDPRVRAAAVSAHPEAPPSELARLAQDLWPRVRVAVARSPTTPDAARVLLARDADWAVLVAVSECPQTPPEALSVLGCQGEFGALLVAQHPSMTPEALAPLVHHAAAEVRRYAATSHALRDPTLAAALAGDLDPTVRAEVASNAATPESVLARLVRDPASEVRRSLLYHPALPEHLGWMLAHDSSLLVRMMLAERGPASERIFDLLARDDYSLVRASLVRNPALSPERVDAACRDADLQVRQGAAWRTRTPGLLRKLARDRESAVRCTVARNPATPLEVVDALRDDAAVDVRENAAEAYAARLRH